MCKHAKQIVDRKHQHADTVDILEILQATREGLLILRKKNHTNIQTLKMGLKLNQQNLTARQILFDY
jgi:hypothetical protein